MVKTTRRVDARVLNQKEGVHIEMKKHFFRFACCLIAVLSTVALSSCSELLLSIFGDEDSSQKSYAEDEWNPNEDALGGNSSSEIGSENGGTDGESEEKDSFIPDAPDSEKELLRTETDDIGHKIAYYADGTKEDLGRVTPIDFTPVSPTEKEGYQYFSTLEKGDGLCAFYRELFTVAYNFHTSDKNVTATEGRYEIADMRFFRHGLTRDEAVSVWRTVSIEYPEFFWWENSLMLGSTGLSFLINPLYAQASERESAQTAIENMAQTCDGYLDTTTTKVERALTVHDYVANITQYAYKEDGVTPETEIWAHNIAGGAQYGKGVCETYAKTYDYLCGLFGLSCITVAGFAVQNGESFGHAWNVVEIDGGWYNVDATWNDLDSKTLSREWFGTTPELFKQSHDEFAPEDGWSVNYMFALPSLDKEGLTPVRAASTDELAGGKYTADNAPMYGSIEDVCALAGEGITVEAYLYPRTAATAQKAEIFLKGARLDRISHTAGTVAINGAYRSLLGGYFEIAELVSSKEITFLGDVVLRDVSYTAPSVNLGDNTLTTAGTAVEIETTGVVSGGNLIDKTTDWTEIFAVDLDTVTAQGNELCLLRGGKVARVNLYSGLLRLNGGQDAAIGTLWYATANERLYIDKATATTKITVGNILAGIEANEEAGTTAVIPDKVTIFVVYTDANDYPIISVIQKTTAAKLNLTMYSDYKTPERLGKAFVNLGETVALNMLQITYSWHGITRELSQSKYEKQENGDVCWK